MKSILIIVLFIASNCFPGPNFAQIVQLGSFNPSETNNDICGLGYDPDQAHLWVYGCSNSTIQCYDTSGNLLLSIPVVGGIANDVDIEIAPVSLQIRENIYPKGQLLFINGESGTADIFVIDNSSGDVLDTLQTQFGASHVVGGAYHHIRNTFFLVQDNIPSIQLRNRIAEINPINGDTLQIFQTTESSNNFTVSYGDLDIGANGNIYVVSSIQDSMAEFTPEGVFVQKHGMPPGVGVLSALAIDCSASQAWVASSQSGNVFHLGNFPCETVSVDESQNSEIRVFPNPATGYLIISSVNQGSAFHLYDILGRHMLSETLVRGTNTVVLPDLPNGQYTYKVDGEPISGIVIIR